MRTAIPQKFYSPDGEGGSAESTTQDAPQEDPGKDGAAAETGKDGKKQDDLETDDAPGKKKPDEADEDELEIEGMEETEDNRIKYTVGDSVYISKEGLKGNRAISDVLKQAREGVANKDKSFRDLKAKTSMRDKVSAAIRNPKDLNDEGEKPPPVPRVETVVAQLLRERGLQPGMDSWSRDKWIEHQQTNILESWEMSELRAKVKAVVDEAEKSVESNFRQFNNFNALKTAEASVRDMLSEVDGVDPSEYTEEYVEVIRRAKKDGLNEFGEIDPSWIVKEFSKKVMKTLSSRQKSQLREQVEKEIAEARERRSKVKPAAAAAAKLDKANPKVTSIADATKQILAEWKKGAA